MPGISLIFRIFPIFGKWGKNGQNAMKGLANEYPQFKSWYPYPKPLIHPRLLSVQQLTGVYSPFTVEANYNSEIPAYNIPHTICHELSHLKGYMREDEANFIGYLACTGSEAGHFAQRLSRLAGLRGKCSGKADYDGL